MIPETLNSGEAENVYMILWQIYSGNCCTKLHQNRPSFIKNIKKHLRLFLPDTVYNLNKSGYILP